MSKQKVNKVIEDICNEGCITVNSVIEALESGTTTDHDHTLTAAERIQVIKELKEIMSVYDEK